MSLCSFLKHWLDTLGGRVMGGDVAMAKAGIALIGHQLRAKVRIRPPPIHSVKENDHVFLTQEAVQK